MSSEEDSFVDDEMISIERGFQTKMAWTRRIVWGFYIDSWERVGEGERSVVEVKLD